MTDLDRSAPPCPDPVPSDELHVLYRFFDAEDQLLYVGITADPGTRWKVHSKQKPGWRQVIRVSLEHFDSRVDLEAAEIEAIKTERPLWNIKYAPARASVTAKTAPVLTRVRFLSGSTSEVEEHARAGVWLSTGAAAKLLDVSRTTLHRLVVNGEIRHRILAGSVHRECHPGDVLRLLDESRGVWGVAQTTQEEELVPSE